MPVRSQGEGENLNSSSSLDDPIAIAESRSLLVLLRKFADRTALHGAADEVCSFGQLADTIERCRHDLVDTLGKGARVISLLPDQPSTALVNAGLCEVATVIPVNPTLTDAELSDFAAGCGADAILCHESAPAIGKLAETFSLSEFKLDAHANSHFADCDIRLVRERPRASNGGNADAALVLTTSGSTGLPKRVPLSWNNLVRSAENIVSTLELGSSDTVVHMLPMFHIGAIVDLFMAPLWAGGAVKFAHPISTESLIASVSDPRVTWFQAVPTMLKALLATADDAVLGAISEHLRFVRSVSADLAPGVQSELEQKLNGVPVIQIYGMTETSGQIASNPLPPRMRKPGSVGVPVGIEIVLLDRFANRVPEGGEGEICLRGPTLMAGYEGTPRESHFHGDWLRTGDVGRFDEDGYLFLVGRVKEIINRGGEKIAPLEIEKRLYELPSVAEAAVFAVPHETLGEDVGVAVAFRRNATEGEEDVRHHLAENLSDFKQPRRIVSLDSLPKLGSGKIDKVRLARDHAPASNTAEPSARPRSRLGDQVAEIWARTLKSTIPEDHEDFFETNGDSLAAQTFTLELEEALSLRIPANLLYEAPTFGALEAALLDLQDRAHPADRFDDVYEAIRATTASWPGVRRDETSLAVAVKNVGTKPPFFFCGGVLTDLAGALDDDRPCYTMRTLSGLKVKSDENNKILANVYADEIDTLQPDGPILLGGLCQGVLVAELIAENLRARGRDIGLFVVIDRIIRGAYLFPAAFIWSETTHYSALNHFFEPERGLPHMFPKGSRALRVGVCHEDLLMGEAAARVGAFMEPLLEAASRGEDLPGKLVAPKGDTVPYPARAARYAARKKLFAPRFGTEGEVFEASVTLTNTSGETWHPTDASGLRVLAKWQRLGGKVIDRIVGVGEIEAPVAPGETCRVSLRITYPRHRSPLFLYVDLVDDGICWFSEAGAESPAKHLMMPRYWMR